MILLSTVVRAAAPTTIPTTTVFDRDSNLIWNRLHVALFARVASDGKVFGLDDVDPLIWEQSTYLLKGQSQKRAIDLLDEFIKTSGEQLVRDPLKRAVMQADLWAIFDATKTRWDDKYRAQQIALQARLAKIITRLRLSKLEVDSLPDNYAAAVASKTHALAVDEANPTKAFLPEHLFEKDGPWVSVGHPGSDEATPFHSEFVSGHALFIPMINLPGGRAETLKYLQQLATFPKPFMINPKYGYSEHGEPDAVKISDDLPQFPVGTQVALVRRMLLIDDHNQIALSPITQTIQLRVYREISKTFKSPSSRIEREKLEHAQAFFEFSFSRERLFKDPATAFKPTGIDERSFVQFQSLPGDVFDELQKDYRRAQIVTMNQCIGCHALPGIYSVNTFSSFGVANIEGGRPRHLDDFGIDYLLERAVQFKHQRYDWGLLQGLMLSNEAAKTPQ